ncbi:serine/arginine repetitive matrix protein 1-like [Teratosphaeria destructans]|uniref:Serine/arginine repetitive matrix protein 1-like n=1 Tax=Teratosphaeria destructans TaxID=418781 RepID=A0A9W7VYN5_9PEZI|nr:serine/arginine repetitive matrix protein 1-like [Teratosphaeria destructans]
MESSYYGTGRQEVLPASQYLQERLQERRARNLRPKRTRQSDFGPRRAGDDDIFLDEAEASRARATRMYDSSPLAAASLNSDHANSGYHKRPSMGVKDLDGQLDKLNKQNFALKLELSHRREQTQKLQEQIGAMRAQFERAEQLEQEHTQLLEINTRLVEELEKRDKAVEEAMDIICELEDKAAEMEERRTQTRPSTAQADSGYAGTETHEQAPPSSPPELLKQSSKTSPSRHPPPAASAASNRLQSLLNGDQRTPARMRREPSFMSQKKSSTHALRSVYLENARSLRPVQSFNSLLSKRDSRLEDNDLLDSPRLSTLSESSFPSLYSPKKQITPEKYAWEGVDGETLEVPYSEYRQDSINRVSRWIDNGDSDLDDTPSKITRTTSPLSQRTARVTSPSPADPGDDAGYQSLGEAVSIDQLQPSACGQASKQRRRSEQMSSDSANTRMLRASFCSEAGERSLLDTTPAIVRGFDPLQPVTRTAPKQMRSSIELKSAYLSHMRLREDAGAGNAKDDASSDDEDDAHTVTVKDLSLDYDGFPDGNSILMGTPSRFLKHSKPPAGQQVSGDGTVVSPVQPIRRRVSGSAVSPSPRKPSLGRADSGPTFPGSMTRTVTDGSKATIESTTSARTHRSASSSNKTFVQGERGRKQSLAPGEDTTQVSVTSPSRSLSQRTQKLFRRLSNSHSERSDPLRSPTLRTALPTLTSTPSAAYVNHVSKETRKPSASHDKPKPPSSDHQHVKTDGGRRPSLTSRVKTAPTTAAPTPEPPKAAALERDKKPNIFRRRDSSKNTSTPPPATLNGSNTTPNTAPSGAAKEARQTNSRRRSSIREAVTSRKPWR